MPPSRAGAGSPFAAAAKLAIFRSLSRPRPTRWSFFSAKPCSRARSLGTAAIGDAPDRAFSILADEERAVMRHGDADRARPNRGVVDDKSGHEVLVFAARRAVLEPHAHHFV